jgi:GNAT superfamily N-acetyltransferase
MTHTLTVRTIAPHERAAVLDLLGEWISREFFGRYFAHDSAFQDELCFVALDGDRFVGTLQVFSKEIRAGRTALRVGGVGNVFTTESHRQRGVASQLLAYAFEVMRSRQFDLSLLFAVRLAFYGRLGWAPHRRLFVFLDPAEPPLSARACVVRFEHERDLDGVMKVFDSYSGRLPGTTVRNRDYWLGQLHCAGNPSEEFVVARADGGNGAVVAYARATSFYDYYLVMEHGCLPGREAALVDLTCHLHGGPARAFPGTLTQLAFEPGVLAQLRERGLTLRTVEDVFWMWRVVSPERVARKLGLPVSEVGEQGFFDRILPPEGSVYWLSDRF